MSDRLTLDRIVAAVAEVPDAVEKGSTALDRMAFFINAYNVLTLRAIVDHYPSRIAILPVAATASADRRRVDHAPGAPPGTPSRSYDIDHVILRQFGDARVHIAVNRPRKLSALRAAPTSARS